MTNWNVFQTGWEFIWKDPIGWFLELTLFTQILLIIAILAITIATIILIYYIIKGVAYLLYYLFKGLYYLFKGIFLGIYKLFEALYYAISGKPKKKAPIISQPPTTPTVPPEHMPNLIEKNEVKTPSYCTECGQKMTESLSSLLVSRGVAFCFYCGKEFKLETVENPNF